MQQMTPRELDHCMAHTRIACFSKPSLAPFLTALVRCPCKAEASEIGLYAVHNARAFPDQALALAARAPCILILDCRDRSHAAVLRLTAQPAEKGALE